MIIIILEILKVRKLIKVEFLLSEFNKNEFLIKILWFIVLFAKIGIEWKRL